MAFNTVEIFIAEKFSASTINLQHKVPLFSQKRQYRVPVTMASIQHHISLAKSLPPRLTRFFAKYPPQAILPSATSPNAPESTSPISNDSEATPSPFKARKFPITGKWHNPKFSLRRQAELVKLARQHGVEELLPHTVKGTAERIRRREEQGLRVKGTGIGEKVKGKAWERTLKGRYVQIILHCIPDVLKPCLLASHIDADC